MDKKISNAITSFLIIYIFQGLICLGLMLSNPSIEKPVILGFSMEKLTLIVVFFLFVLTLGLILFVRIKYLNLFENIFQKVIITRYSLLKPLSLSFFVFVEVISLYLYSISPLYISKLWPFLVWISLFLLGLFILAEYIGIQRPPESSKIRTKIYEVFFGILFLFFGILISSFTKYSILFVDEADHITTGWLMTKGFRLYSDIFSHHPPLVYYWVAGVVRLFGNNFIAIRMSIVGLWVIIFVTTMLLTNKYLSVGLLVFIWSILSYFYLGNLILYQAFAGIFLAASIITFLSLTSRKLSLPSFVWIGLLCGLAILSDPQYFLASGILFLAIVAFLIVNFGVLPRRIFYKYLLAFFLPFIFVIGIQLVIFITGSSLNDFISEAIIFNKNIYSQYTKISALNPFPSIWRQFINGLFVFNPYFRSFTELVKDLSLPAKTTIDQWLFGGFYFRLGVICVSIALIVNKDIRGFFLYLIACTLFPRSISGFHALAFITFAISTIAFFLIREQEPGENIFSRQILNAVMRFTLLWFLVALLFK